MFLRILLLSWLIPLVLLAAAAAEDSPEPVVSLGWLETEPVAGAELALRAPRSYGFVVADRFSHRIDLTVNGDYRLEPASVPAERNFAGGLERQRVRVETSGTVEQRSYSLHITYQIFAAPEEPRVYAVPPFTLTVSGDGETLQVPVPEWRFTVSPLIGGAVDRTPGSGRMLPALPPRPADTRGPLLGLLLCAGGGVGLAFFLWGVPLLQRGVGRSPFTRTVAVLRELRRGRQADALSRGVRAVHRALDEVAGQTLLARDLPVLLEREPWLRGARPELEAFFRLSAGVFYGAAQDGQPDTDKELAALQELVRHCRRLERCR